MHITAGSEPVPIGEDEDDDLDQETFSIVSLETEDADAWTQCSLCSVFPGAATELQLG